MNFIDKYNTITATLITILTAMFGVYWYIFFGYLLCNVLDYATGWWKARKLREESSKVGLNGILKKVGYWIIILISFLLPQLFIELGNDLLGLDLSFMVLMGWFTLATLLINEIRSILENLVQCGCQVPEYLMRGLAITEKLIRSKTGDPM